MPRYTQDRARYEGQLAAAHRALHNAKLAAEAGGDEGAVLDLDMLLVEVTRMAQASLRGKAKPQIKGQLRIAS